MKCVMWRNRPSGQVETREVEYPDGQEPAEGEKRQIDGWVWERLRSEKPAQNLGPFLPRNRPTVAHSMPRRGDPRDPGAPRYDRRGRPVLETTEERLTYAKRYEQHNNEPCRFERTSSQGAFDDED